MRRHTNVILCSVWLISSRICTSSVGRKDVACPQVNGCLALWRIGYLLLQVLTTLAHENTYLQRTRTNFSNTHLFILRSSDRQFHSC
jgi:hypothetical protein